MATGGVDFFRVDRSGATRRLLIIAGGLVTAGATTIGAHLVSNFAEGPGRALTLLGGVVTLAGLVLGFGTMAMMLFENVYLLIKEEGLLLHDNGNETTVPWPELEEAALDEKEGFVVFRRKGASPVRWFAGGGAKLVKSRVEDAKRKALHGLLRIESR